jgi:hypothetical protein
MGCLSLRVSNGWTWQRSLDDHMRTTCPLFTHGMDIGVPGLSHNGATLGFIAQIRSAIGMHNSFVKLIGFFEEVI